MIQDMPTVPEMLEISGYQAQRTAAPKGMADAVIENLFPEQRSSVPIDDERRKSVYAILQESGVIAA